MACSHIEGTWPDPTLLADTGEVTRDPVLVITPGGGSGFKGRFQVPREPEFDVHCTQHALHSEVSFTRTHLDGMTTAYTAIHVRIRPRRNVDIFAGRFTRRRSDGSILAVGDWETEKPT